MKRVIAQGDLRPIGESGEAMQDLKAILASRANAYAKADLQIDTSRQSLPDTFNALRQLMRHQLAET